jgi:hypothetical protein
MRNRMFRRFSALFAVGLLFASPSASASCGSSSCPIELHVLTPNDMRFAVDLSFQYIDQKTLKGSFSGVEDHQELRTINRLTALQVFAPISSRFQVGVTVPFVDRTHEHIDLQSNALERWNISSVGDIALQGRARLFERNGNAPHALWMTAIVKFPTGKQDVAAVGGGENAEVPLVPGSGSVDEVIGLSYESGVVRNTQLHGEFGRATFLPYFVSASFRHNGRGTNDYKIGSEFQLNAGTAYPLNRRVDLLAQLNARLRAKDEPGTTGENPDLTGGEYLYASPGVTVDIGRNAALYTYIQLPMYQHVNGSQLTAHANFLLGVRQHF